MASDFDNRFKPVEHLQSDLANLALGWIELGIDPDDFLRCGTCHKWITGIGIEEDPDIDVATDMCECPDEEGA